MKVKKFGSIINLNIFEETLVKLEMLHLKKIYN